MIYLVKIVCPSCQMKIELGEEHFNMALDCPNCGNMFTLPNPNELKDENIRLKKEVEILKNSAQNTPAKSVPNTGFKRKQGTLKLGKADLIDTPPTADIDTLKKENEELKAKLEEVESLNVSLKAELAAALKELADLKNTEVQDPFAETLVSKTEVIVPEKDKKEEILRSSNVAADVDFAETLVGDVDHMAETIRPFDPLAETAEGPGSGQTVADLGPSRAGDTEEVIEYTIKDSNGSETSAETFKVPAKPQCVSCNAEMSVGAKFCTICGTKQ